MTANRKNTLQSEPVAFRAIGYCRLSKEHGALGVSDSIANQRKLIRAYVEKQPDMELVGEFFDDGYTGTNYDRPGFRSVLEAVERGRANCVIVKDLSRLGREYVETGKYLEQTFPELGVRFIAINDDVDSAGRSSGDDIIIPIKNIMNESYCRELSKKLRAQFRIQRSRGEFLGAFACFGYRKDPDDRHKLVVDGYAAEVVRSIFSLKLRGFSHDRIARFLNDEKVLPPAEYKRSTGLRYQSGFEGARSSGWTAVAVGRILKNPVYIGTLVQGRRGTANYKLREMRWRDESDWVVVEHNHPAIIEPAVFEIVQQQLSRDTRTPPGCDTVLPLAGVLFCPDCGAPMQRRGVNRAGRRYHYYVCSTYKKGLGCRSHSIGQAKLEGAVLHALLAQIEVLAELDRLAGDMSGGPLAEARARRIDTMLARREEELERCENFRAKLYEALSEGLIDRDEYGAMRRRYSEQIDAARESIDALQRRRAEQLSPAGEGRSRLDTLLKYRGAGELTREAVVMFIDRVYVCDGGRIRIDFNFRDELDACRELLSGEAG